MGLSPKEWLLVNLVAFGRMNKEIAYETRCSEATVKVQLTRLRDKLGYKMGIREFVIACERLSGCLGS